MSSSTRGGSSKRAATGPAIVVSHWPLRDDPVRSVLRVALAVGVAAMAGYFSGQLLVGTVVAAVVLASMWRMFVPVVYELGVEGIALGAFGRVRRIPWRAVRNCDAGQSGMFLSGSENPAPVDAIGAVFIPWCGQRDAIEALVRVFVWGEEPVSEETGDDDEPPSDERPDDADQANKQAT